MTSPIPHTHVRRISALEKRTATLTKNLAKTRTEKLELVREANAMRARLNAFERGQLEAWEADLVDLLGDIRALLDANVRKEKRS